MSDVTYKVIKLLGEIDHITVTLKGVGMVGRIKPIDDRWAYYPCGYREHGEVFDTIAEVKHSLERG